VCILGKEWRKKTSSKGYRTIKQNEGNKKKSKRKFILLEIKGT
jgi:hypothetical protein